MQGPQPARQLQRQHERWVLTALACGCGALLAAVAGHQASGVGVTTRPASPSPEIVRVTLPLTGATQCEPISRATDGTLMARCGDGYSRVWVEVKDGHQRILIIEPIGGPSLSPTPTATAAPPFGPFDT